MSNVMPVLRAVKGSVNSYATCAKRTCVSLRAGNEAIYCLRDRLVRGLFVLRAMRIVRRKDVADIVARFPLGRRRRTLAFPRDVWRRGAFHHVRHVARTVRIHFARDAYDELGAVV